MEHEIENHIRGYRDNDLNGVLKYVCGEPFASPSYCYTHDLVYQEGLLFLMQNLILSLMLIHQENHIPYMVKLHIV